MRHTRIALYDIKSGSYDDILGQANAGLVPMFKSSPGFLSFGMAEIDKAAFVSVSNWETLEQADTATSKAADWVKSNSKDHFALRACYVGGLTIDTDSRESVGTAR